MSAEIPKPMAPGNPIVQAIEKESMTALITGILSFICCPLIAIWTLISAAKVKRMIAENGVGQEHLSKATIGKVLAIVAIVLNLLGIAIYAIFLVFIIAAAGAGAAV